MTLYNADQSVLIDHFSVGRDAARVTITLGEDDHVVLYEGKDAVDLLLSDAKKLIDAAAEMALLRKLNKPAEK